MHTFFHTVQEVSQFDVDEQQLLLDLFADEDGGEPDPGTASGKKGDDDDYNDDDEDDNPPLVLRDGRQDILEGVPRENTYKYNVENMPEDTQAV
eukprot:4918478-Karenia_brevis.AAC.1